LAAVASRTRRLSPAREHYASATRDRAAGESLVEQALRGARGV
jgi:hypothetical protein